MDGEAIRPALPRDPAVAHDDDAGRDLQHLAELVADEDEGDAQRGPATDIVLELGGTPGIERGCRLVEDQQLQVRVAGGAGDLDHLALAEGKVFQARIGIDPAAGEHRLDAVTGKPAVAGAPEGGGGASGRSSR